MMNKLLTAYEKGYYETAFFVTIDVQDGLSRILYAAEKGRWPIGKSPQNRRCIF